MASAAPTPAEQGQHRPSFAKVAASAIKSPVPKDSMSKPRPPVATPKFPVQAPKVRNVLVGAELPKVVVEAADAGCNATGHIITPTLQRLADGVGMSTLPLPEKADDIHGSQSLAVVQVAMVEEISTQLSLSDGSGKPPSLDGKSVASATTFALDEKESLRPDDSASLMAVEEEDIISPPDSVVADSRQGSDNGAARAFRDQLHEIAVMNSQPHRGVPPGRFPSLANSPYSLYDPNQLPANARPISQPLVNGVLPTNGSPSIQAIPDEKLLEALQSPRDRLFVVKIEQDFIDFIKDSGENEYCLPNCNTFYRMLAHRLADYYLLGHVVDTAMSGVKITRTPYCRIPPPLSQMLDPAKGANTPPVDLPARKIMRRDDGKSGTNTTANSQNPSKTASEVEGSDASNDGKEKDKGALTREEREARYREARQRIFGNAEAENTDAIEVTGEGEEGEREKEQCASRSSSALGKKKNKKQRNYDDDDFTARSCFNVYYPQQYPVPGHVGENAVYFPGFAGPMPNPQYTSMNPGASPPAAYSTPYPVVMSSDPQYNWSAQQYASPNPPMLHPGYGPIAHGYDLSTNFQQGMASFQNAGMPSQITPKMANPQMAQFQEGYQQVPHMTVNTAWSQTPQQPYAMPQGSFPPGLPHNRPLSAPQLPGPSPYTYGQFPTSSYNTNSSRNQHPLPGSYNRPQFNPQTQAFIPTGRGMPYLPQANISQGPPPMMNGYGMYQMPGQGPIPPHMPRLSSPVNSSPSFGSPQSTQGHSAAVMNRIASQSGEVPSTQSSIAKYGTPSHLPAKPPAPAPAQHAASKFGLLLPSTTRASSMASPGPVGAPTVISKGMTG